MNSDFTLRLTTIMEHYGLSPSILADQIGIRRSTLSHIINGRNRPSLNFVMKLVQQFPEVSIYWLLNGKGDFPKLEQNGAVDGSLKTKSIVGTKNKVKKPARIVIFYDDGSFESFEPKN